MEHPPHLSDDFSISAASFRLHFGRAHLMQASLTILSLLGAVSASLIRGDVAWLVGGVLVAAVLGLTVTVIKPVNRRLLDPALDTESSQARELLTRWGRLHAARAALSLLALAVLCYASLAA